MATNTALDICPVDGGRIQSEIRGSRLIRTCMRCGIEERLEYADPEAAAFKKMDELERELVDEADGVDDNVDTDGPSRTEPLPEGVVQNVVDSTRRAQERQAARIAPLDWREVAKSRMNVLLEQLTSAEEAAKEARQIHTALTACGIELDPLPGYIDRLLQ